MRETEAVPVSLTGAANNTLAGEAERRPVLWGARYESFQG